ncbi:MAG: helix-hairpin-helix domain-containing protein [Acidobacteria bacterium]|nr:helix-hairpin-helix domain-containing protein [Acidobacteriota bacterium]
MSDMIGRGAPLMEGEQTIVVQYLSKNFGVDAPKINLNRATAKELETAFGLSLKESEEIVRYRQQNGPMLGWQELRKVPGLEVKKIEAKKDQVAF